jgi:hypothetical protein
MQSDVAFDEFDGDEAEGEGADNGLASSEIIRIVQVMPGELRVLQPEKEFGAERGAGDCGSDHGPAERSADGISKAAAEPEVDKEGDDVGEGLEEEVRMECVGTEVKINRECGGGMK